MKGIKFHINCPSAQKEFKQCVFTRSGTYNNIITGLCLWIIVMETTVDHSSTEKVIFYLGCGELETEMTMAVHTDTQLTRMFSS